MTAGALLGVGIVGFIDETILHQLLHWHHLWDGGSPDAGLVSDGLFHSGSWISLVVSLFWFADQRRRGTIIIRAWVAGMFLGAGGFQVYDGVVQHLIFHLHQIRYGVRIWPYNVVWIGCAVIMLIIAGLLLRRTAAAPGRNVEPGGAALTCRLEFSTLPRWDRSYARFVERPAHESGYTDT